MKFHAMILAPREHLRVTILLLAAALLIVWRPSAASEKYAAQTGKPCAQCHAYPAGDLKLTPFGQAFVANGYKLPPEQPPAPADGSKAPAGATAPPK
jgi:hypothetical protein